MHRNDVIRLRHILDAAHEAMSFAQGRTRKDLNIDRMLVLSLVKDIEIIGEAACKSRKLYGTNWRAYRGKTSSVCDTVSCMPTLTSILISFGEPCRMTFPL